MKSENTFFVSIRMGPGANLIYEMGNAVGDYFFIPVTNFFPGSSWSTSSPLVQETNNQVNEAIQGISTNNPFFIEKLKLFVPEGVDSPTTFPKLSFGTIAIFKGNASGNYSYTRLPIVAAYDKSKEQDRYFEFNLNLHFDQWCAITFETPQIAGNWVDTTSIPLAIAEFTVSQISRKLNYVIA